MTIIFKFDKNPHENKANNGMGNIAILHCCDEGVWSSALDCDCVGVDLLVPMSMFTL